MRTQLLNWIVRQDALTFVSYAYGPMPNLFTCYGDAQRIPVRQEQGQARACLYVVLFVGVLRGPNLCRPFQQYTELVASYVDSSKKRRLHYDDRLWEHQSTASFLYGHVHPLVRGDPKSEGIAQQLCSAITAAHLIVVVVGGGRDCAENGQIMDWRHVLRRVRRLTLIPTSAFTQ